MDKDNLEFFKDKADNSGFINKLLPEVFMSTGDVQKFNPKSIVKSIMKETDLSRKDSRKVTELVVRRIIASGIQFLSGPHIRELVCSALSELNFEEERKKFTRIGMPIHDYERLLDSRYNARAAEYTAPENIHRWAADQLASEYALLKLLSNDQARAHLSGDIHIHSLRYFDMRPFSQAWDIRMILEHGLPPTSFLNSTVAKPAKKALAAIMHASKWMGFAHSEFSGEQCYPFFNTFMSPYLKGLLYDDIKQLAQSFIFEINQQTLSQGSHIPASSIVCSPYVPKSLRDIDAIGPNGKKVGVYGDYDNENLQFFNALSEIYSNGDGNGKLFAFPKHKVLVEKKDFSDENVCANLLKETANMGTPIFINKSSSWINDEGYFGPFFTNPLRKIYIQEILGENFFDWSNSYVNSGSLQSLTINLPRIAYESKGNDDKLKEMLLDRMEIVKEILLIKYNLIKRLIDNNSLPLCSSKVRGKKLLNLKSQALTFGIVGLNEMIKAHTKFQIHEDNTALELGKEIIKLMTDKCEEYTREHRIFFTLWEQPTEFASFRFASLDLKHFSSLSKSNLNGNIETGSVWYTPSTMLNFSENIDMTKKIEIHKEIAKIVQNNCSLPIWVNNSEDNNYIQNVSQYITNFIDNGVNEFSLNYDFSFCPNCGKNVKGIADKCQECSIKENKMRIISKITDYYSPLELWNPGKREEFKNRKRINI